MSTTVTNYLSRINRNFPVKGQDNDSQGFRDNWKNIYRAINSLNEELDILDYTTVKTNDPSNFYGNTFEDITIKNASQQFIDLGTLSGPIKIDYSRGSYQKFELEPGLHQLTASNWPSPGKSGKIRLSITVTGNSYCAINFDSNYTPIISSSNLFELSQNKINIFDLWSEEGSSIVYVTYLNVNTVKDQEFSSTVWTNILRLGPITDQNQSNIFYTGTNKSTIVKRQNQIAQLGIVPNRITKSLIEGLDKVSTNTVELFFDNVSKIVPGAFLYNSLNNTKFTVTQVTTNSVHISPDNFNVSLLNISEPITITNPIFVDQPTLFTLNSTSANTFTGSISNYKSSIFADKNTLEVTYKDYGNSLTNTFFVKTIQTSTETSIVSNAIASAKFVHSLLPMGTVIMWYGRAVDVPYGWTICDNKGSIASIIDGQPGPIIKIPNLSDRFVVGGEIDVFEDLNGAYRGPGTTVASTITQTRGGYSNSAIVNHTHDASFEGNAMPLHYHTIIDPGHNHSNNYYTQLLPTDGGGDGDYVNNSQEANINSSSSMLSVMTSISLDRTSIGTASGIVYVYERGISGVAKNIPPFYALYYIMKISGISNSKLPTPSGDNLDPREPNPWPAAPPVPPPPPPPPEQPVPSGVTRLLQVVPLPVPTFEFVAGEVSSSVSISLLNTGTSAMKIYSISSNSVPNVNAIFSPGVSGAYPKVINAGGSYSFTIGYTSARSVSGEFTGNIQVLFQNSNGGVEYRYITTKQNIIASSTGDSDGGGDTDSSGGTDSE